MSRAGAMSDIAFADSQAHVEAGSRLVLEAGTTIDGIVDRIEHLSSLIVGIASSATEQRSDVSIVNGSVAELDQMTQRNAGLVAHSSRAASSLQQQVEALNRVVSVFRLPTGPAAA